MIHYIYKITNLIDSKIYIGKHSTKNIDDNYFGSGVYLKRAIKKHGIDNFKKEILCFCLNEKDLNKQEIYYIKKFESFYNGYNLTKGGEGTLGRKPTKKQKEKQSVTQKLNYKKNPEYRKILSQKAKQRIGEKNPFYGKKLTKEHKEKMTKARILSISGSKNPSAVKLKCVELNKVFYTAKDAAEYVGLKYSTTILKAAKGQRKKAGGYTWIIL